MPGFLALTRTTEAFLSEETAFCHKYDTSKSHAQYNDSQCKNGCVVVGMCTGTGAVSVFNVHITVTNSSSQQSRPMVGVENKIDRVVIFQVQNWPPGLRSEDLLSDLTGSLDSS